MVLNLNSDVGQPHDCSWQITRRVGSSSLCRRLLHQCHSIFDALVFALGRAHTHTRWLMTLSRFGFTFVLFFFSGFCIDWSPLALPESKYVCHCSIISQFNVNFWLGWKRERERGNLEWGLWTVRRVCDVVWVHQCKWEYYFILIYLWICSWCA